MADCPNFKIDSNDTGLRVAIEECLKQLPDPAASVVWHPVEPNSYGDFGGTISTVARDPINPSRQRRKGVVTDLEAAAGITVDFTNDGSLHFMQGFLFAEAREKPTTKPLNGTALAAGAVTTGAFAAPAASGDRRAL